MRNQLMQLTAFLCFVGMAQAAVPRMLNRQGVISVSGVRFNGTGEFRFAIVDPDAPINLWSNDGSITGSVGGIPTAGVSLAVTNGVYSVALGDTNLANMTDEIALSVFADDNALLRIWFDDGQRPVRNGSGCCSGFAADGYRGVCGLCWG